MYLLYSFVTLLALVALSPYFLYQALRHNKYVGSLRQRLGYLPVSFNLDGDDSIWVHAVSVGEVLAARPLIAELRRRYPRLRLFLSTTTLAGQQLARRSVTDVDGVFYFPFDWAFTARRTLDLVKPRLFVMIETEIWPNLLRECRRRGVSTVLVNGRISYRSFPRYRLIRPFFRRVLADVDRFCVQGDEAARRLVAARRRSGAHHRHRQPEVRFARSRSRRPAAAASASCASSGCRRTGRCWWPAARSKGRRRPVIARVQPAAHRAAATRCWCSRARHPERFAEVERLCRQEGLSTIRRTELPIDAEPRADAVVLDTIGELAEVYQIATVVFVGGSLVPRRRPQHPRAGGVRQADRVRSAHGELRRDRGGVSRQRRRGAGAVRARAGRRRSSA